MNANGVNSISVVPASSPQLPTLTLSSAISPAHDLPELNPTPSSPENWLFA